MTVMNFCIIQRQIRIILRLMFMYINLTNHNIYSYILMSVNKRLLKVRSLFPTDLIKTASSTQLPLD